MPNRRSTQARMQRDRRSRMRSRRSRPQHDASSRRDRAEAWPVGIYKASFLDADGAEGIVRDQQIAVEIGPLDRRREMRRRRDCYAGLRRATSEHHLEPPLVSGRDHRARGPDASAFLKLHIDAVARAGQTRHVGRTDGGLVHDDRQLRTLPHPAEAVEVIRRDRLLDELDPEGHEARNASWRLFHGPCGIRIDANHAVEPRAEEREVERILGQQVERRTYVALDGLSRLAEEGVRDALATRNAAVLAELDEHDLLGRVSRTRDRERYRQVELDDVDVGLHAGTAARSA